MLDKLLNFITKMVVKFKEPIDVTTAIDTGYTPTADGIILVSANITNNSVAYFSEDGRDYAALYGTAGAFCTNSFPVRKGHVYKCTLKQSYVINMKLKFYPISLGGGVQPKG